MEVSQLGTIVGFAVNDRVRNLDFDISNFLIYLAMFTSMFLIVLSAAKLRSYKNKIHRLRRKHKHGLITLDLD